ncbi:pirin family protein [Amphibiibacter pelophylacis]|uniref:Pirin family protein n=1 Tax=Amphibiibacter pelophylacis TaxID=1799477 RepID=A0ACC6P065_9BURK
MSATIQRYPSRESRIGEDTLIRRALPHRDRRLVGAWCFLDHAGPTVFASGKGLHVGAHPHIGLQTFTWMIEGEVMHRDSLGYEQVIRPGQVNLMTAGRGIAHSEDSVRDGDALHAAQLWIALPQAHANCEPAFAHHANLPRWSQGGFDATLLVGTLGGQTAPAQVFSPLLGLDLTSTGAAHTSIELDTRFEHAAIVLRGAATLAGEALAPGDWLYFATGRTRLDVSCDSEAQILLLGGEPLGEDILLWWNFVGRTQADIEAALADWQADDSTRSARFGPLPTGSRAAPLLAPRLEGALKAGR